jgi:hypothetical protein
MGQCPGQLMFAAGGIAGAGSAVRPRWTGEAISGADLGRQHEHPHVGPLGCLEQQIERLFGPALLLGHHNALGLLDHGYAPRLPVTLPG